MSNFIKASIILSEIILAIWLVSGLIQSGYPSNVFFWIATLLEIGLGYLTYQIFKRYLADKSYKTWNFIILGLTIVGIGTPIVLYNIVDFLKPVGVTWLIYVLTVNSLYLYRIIRKQPIIRADVSPTRRFLTFAKVFHSIILSIILILVVFAAILPLLGSKPVYTNDYWDLIASEIGAAIFIIPCFAIGLSLHKLVSLIKKTEISDFSIYFIHAFQCSSLIVVGVFGILFRLLGDPWFVWLILLILSEIGLIFTFPTKKRWLKWKNAQNKELSALTKTSVDDVVEK